MKSSLPARDFDIVVSPPRPFPFSFFFFLLFFLATRTRRDSRSESYDKECIGGDLHPRDFTVAGALCCKAGNKEIPSTSVSNRHARRSSARMWIPGRRPGGCENKTVKNNSRIAWQRAARRCPRGLLTNNRSCRLRAGPVLNARLYGQAPSGLPGAGKTL